MHAAFLNRVVLDIIQRFGLQSAPSCTTEEAASAAARAAAAESNCRMREEAFDWLERPASDEGLVAEVEVCTPSKFLSSHSSQAQISRHCNTHSCGCAQQSEQTRPRNHVGNATNQDTTSFDHPQSCRKATTRREPANGTQRRLNVRMFRHVHLLSPNDTVVQRACPPS